jgi:hypothetical protein
LQWQVTVASCRTRARHGTTAAITTNTMATSSFAFAPHPDCMLLLEKLPSKKIICPAVLLPLEEEIAPEISWTWDERSRRSSGSIDIEHPILRTCKQLRHESGRNLFRREYLQPQSRPVPRRVARPPGCTGSRQRVGCVDFPPRLRRRKYLRSPYHTWSGLNLGSMFKWISTSCLG